jgi:hypothetical protein
MCPRDSVVAVEWSWENVTGVEVEIVGTKQVGPGVGEVSYVDAGMNVVLVVNDAEIDFADDAATGASPFRPYEAVVLCWRGKKISEIPGGVGLIAKLGSEFDPGCVRPAIYGHEDAVSVRNTRLPAPFWRIDGAKEDPKNQG